MTTPLSGLQKDFFISYNKADLSWAEWIAWQLEEAGYTTVLQAWDFRPGSNFVLEMHDGPQAQRTIAVLSHDYLASLYTQPEWAAAFAQDPTGARGILLPIRVRECALTGLLSPIIYSDLVGLDASAAREKLLADVRRERAKPTQPPAFPENSVRPTTAQPRFPGQLPSFWNLPHGRNPNFTGRRDGLARTKEALAEGYMVALTGMGGIGKTQLAVEYAYRYAGEYDVVWWMPAAERATLAEGYVRLAEALKLPECGAPDQYVTVRAVQRWLGQHAHWLLVLDNACDVEHVRDYLPQGHAGHIILTSRDPNWRGAAAPVPVSAFEAPEAAAFLIKRTGRIDQDAAAALSNELGYLPLALEQAAAYVEATGRTLGEYLDLYRHHRLQLLERGTPSTDYPDTVRSTWLLSFEQVKAASPAGADLLTLCAFLAPDALPRDVVRDGARYLPPPLAATVVDPLRFDEAVAALRRYSLLEAVDDGLSVHRLVQSVVRDSLEHEPQTARMWLIAAVGIVDQAFPANGDDPRTWWWCARILPHVLAALDCLAQCKVIFNVAADIWRRVGLYLLERGQLAAASESFERMAVVSAQCYGATSELVATATNNMGSVFIRKGDLDQAWEHYARALEINEAILPPTHPAIAINLSNLGQVLLNLERPGEALPYFERALPILEAAHGLLHPDVAKVTSNLGHALQNLGRLDEAYERCERMVTIIETSPGTGPSHPLLATALTNLGQVLRQMEKPVAARACLERAWHITEASYPPDHPLVATVLFTLGSVLQDVGDQTALDVSRRLLISVETFHAHDQRHLSNALKLLGRILLERRELPEARERHERALAIDEILYGPDHITVGFDLNALGCVLLAQQDWEGAEGCFERAYAIFLARLGATDPYTTRTQDVLARLTERIGER